MSSPPPPTEPEAIPASLRAQLEDFRKHLWRRKILEAAVAGFIGLVASFLLVYGLDRLWPTPGVVRFAVLLAGISLLAVFAPYWIHRWVWRHRRENQLARLIARRFPGLGGLPDGPRALFHGPGGLRRGRVGGLVLPGAIVHCTGVHCVPSFLSAVSPS